MLGYTCTRTDASTSAVPPMMRPLFSAVAPNSTHRASAFNSKHPAPPSTLHPSPTPPSKHGIDCRRTSDEGFLLGRFASRLVGARKEGGCKRRLRET
jgi:hypothetical protein